MIKNLLLVVTILFSVISFPSNTLAIPEPKQKTVQELVAQYSKEYGVSATRMMKTIECENRELDPKLQSRLTYKKGNRWKKPAGSFEESYGLVQIHLPDHPYVTKAQATDAEFSVEFMAKNFKDGNASWWSCYNKLYS